MPRRRHPADPRRETERWFLANGLSYFVPGERAAARAALRPRHLLPLAALVLLATAALGGTLGWVSQQVSAAPAVWLTLVILAALWYASTALHARPILTFALRRTVRSAPLLVGTAMRALPLLLLFVAFLFINAEAWEMSASLPFATHWLVVLLLLFVANPTYVEPYQTLLGQLILSVLTAAFLASLWWMNRASRTPKGRRILRTTGGAR